MLRKLQLFLLLCITAVIFISCEENESYNELATSVDAISFYTASDTIELTEGVLNYPILVKRNSIGIDPVTIKYEITNTNVSSGVDYSIANTQAGEIIIPSNESSALLLINLINNDIAGQEGREFTISLKSADSYNLDGSPNRFTDITVVILDDDCLISPNLNLQPTIRAFGENAPAYDLQVAEVTAETNTFTVNSAWGPNFVAWATENDSYAGRFPYSGKFVINCDNSVVFTGYEEDLPGGNGTYDPDKNEVKLELKQSLFRDPFTVNATYKLP